MAVNRRDFLKFMAGAGLFASSSTLDLTAYPRAIADEAIDSLKVVKHTIKIGATQPFTAIHISDTHLTFAGDCETDHKRQVAHDRARYFGETEIQLRAAVDYAKQRNAILLHSGDMIDFTSEKNFEFLSSFYAEEGTPEHIVSAGNHEFSHCPGESIDDEPYKLLSFDRVQMAFPNDLRFYSRVVNGVNFVAFDDVYYDVADNIIELFKKEIEKGLPIVTLCHVPFYSPELAHFMLDERKESSSYAMGAPDRIDPATGEPFKNAATFLDWIKTEPLFKAHLSGHLHVNHVSQFSESATQYVVGGHYKGDVFEFHFE